MAAVDTNKFVELLQRSKLVDDDALATAIAAIEEAHGGALPDDVEKLSKAFVERKAITAWQAEKLRDGKHKGFFLNKYKLHGHLGTGGMSSVYLAEHVHMHTLRAIKVLPQSRVADSSYLERFYMEAKAAGALSHPNIVATYDIDSEENIHYIVMEYVDGSDLQALVRREGPLDWIRAADYIAQAAAGLQHSHEAGLIHRDVKPANLLVDGKGIVKVLDLGLAMFSNDGLNSLEIAQEESVLGTADYLAPEQAVNSHSVDARADVYSLGCTLYFLLTGQPPFPDGTLQQRLMAHQKEQPKSILELRPGAPRDLVGICQQMMIKSPTRRIQTAARVEQLLRRFIENYKPGDSSKELGGKSKPTLPSVNAGSRAGESSGRLVLGDEKNRMRDPAMRDTVSASGGSSTIRGKGLSGSKVNPTRTPAGKSGASKIAPAVETVNEAGQVVIDIGMKSGDASGAKPSLIEQRREFTQRHKKTPIWLWAVIGGGLLAVILLALMMLFGGS